MHKLFLRVSPLLVCGLLGACISPAQKTEPPKTIGMANPASVYCLQQGGKLLRKQDASGGEFSLCALPDGQQIEEWALYRAHHAQ